MCCGAEGRETEASLRKVLSETEAAWQERVEAVTAESAAVSEKLRDQEAVLSGLQKQYEESMAESSGLRARLEEVEAQVGWPDGRCFM